MIADPEVLHVLMEAVGDEVPLPEPYLKRRFEPEDGILIVSLPREEANELMMRSLNRAASGIYLMCNGCRTIRDIVDAMSEAFSKEPYHRIAEDVIRTIRDLQADGLLAMPGVRRA